MKKNHFASILIVVSFSALNLQAQDSLNNHKSYSISVEEVITEKRQFFQLMLNKTFTENEKFGLLSITSYGTDYNENFGSNEYQNTTLIYNKIYKGFGVNSGTSFTSIESLKNFAGLQFMIQSPVMSLILMSNYHFNNKSTLSNFALIEYKPSINKDWSFYSRTQLHFKHSFDNESHIRSYAYSRVGLTYKYFSFGFAHNYDLYGASKSSANNSGIFLKLTM